MKTRNTVLATFLATGLLVALGGGVFVWSGVYDPGADSPHWPITYALMQTTRARAVERHSGDIVVPSHLDDPRRIAEGAEHYAEMCTGCHLAPGMDDSELRPGLYPMPPNLSTAPPADPRTAFWIIKHGLKMSGMPSWAASHSDSAIWAMVAFLQKLPTMTPAQYHVLIADTTPHDGACPRVDAAAPARDAHDGSGHATRSD